MKRVENPRTDLNPGLLGLNRIRTFVLHYICMYILCTFVLSIFSTNRNICRYIQMYIFTDKHDVILQKGDVRFDPYLLISSLLKPSRLYELGVLEVPPNWKKPVTQLSLVPLCFLQSKPICMYICRYMLCVKVGTIHSNCIHLSIICSDLELRWSVSMRMRHEISFIGRDADSSWESHWQFQFNLKHTYILHVICTFPKTWGFIKLAP
jgi:hypothetical protein